jgi:hypothetical protein
LPSPASRSLPDARRGERVADDEELRRLLAGTFGFDVPAELLTAAAQGL